MAETVKEVMSADPVALEKTQTIHDAAREMRERDIGAIVVVENSHVEGIVTDRDIVVRAIADGRAPDDVLLEEICSETVVTVEPDQSVDEVIQIMRDRAVRRVPVVENDRPVGIVSIGDLAVDRDSKSALADISAAEPNS